METQETYGTYVKDTKNFKQYQTEWGVVYIPFAVAEALGNPTRIKVTVEAAS